jgi:S-adenosyl-L-methionine hydrolase (adenosine-forming)
VAVSFSGWGRLLRRLPVKIVSMSARGPCIALLTDFGTADPYVAAMKGVLASRTTARVADLSHDIAPYDVFEAALFLSDLAPYWPDGTIFVAVVDPGVGSERRIVIADDGRHLFLAPDNGLLSFVIDEGSTVHRLDEETLEVELVSRTFHGRDLFAPAAAALAEGKSAPDLGRLLPSDELVRLDYRPPQYRGGEASGSVIRIDRFGNIVTDLEAERLPPPAECEAVIGLSTISDSAESYLEGPEGRPFLIIGSRGTFEISVCGASAAEALQTARSAPVLIRPRGLVQ